MRFAHIADCHLGFEQYQLDQRKRDFAHSFTWTISDIIRRHKKSPVDFIMIVGDLFHHKYPDYSSLKVFREAKNRCEDEGIIIYGCTGNHDDTKYITWLDYFDIPVLGNDYEYSVQSLNWSSDIVDRSLEIEPTNSPFKILMLHQGIDRYSGKIKDSDLTILKKKFDYLALGHIHIPYEIDGFAYNPGSLEYTSLDNWGSEGGYYFYDSGEVNHIVSPKRVSYRCKVNIEDNLDKEEILGYTRVILDVKKDSMVHIDVSGKRISTEIIKYLETELLKDGYLRVKVKNYTSEDELIVYPTRDSDDDIYDDVFGESSLQVKEILKELDNPTKVISLL